MDKIVIFDWGGVVESHEEDMKELNDAKIRLIKRYNSMLTEEEILKRWTDKTLSGLCIGALNEESLIYSWVEHLEKNMKINVPFLEFKNAYLEEFSKVSFYKEVVEYVHSLKGKCKIAILSNLTPFDKPRIDFQYHLSKFDYVYLSFEIGLRKPSKEIYEYVLKDCKLLPQNILFIDDDEKNIESANECGWNTCQAFGYELDKIKKEVERFLQNN